MQDEPLTPTGQDINARIGGRVRALRTEQGLSLDALAARCDVSRSMLSLIERGESSPTAVVLEKIATGLGVVLATLFDDTSAATSPVSRPAERTPWRDPQTGYLRRNLSPAGFPSPIQLVEVLLPAGARVAYETGAREASIHQQIWVLEGSIAVTLGEATYRLDTGDCFAMQLNDTMTFHNFTAEPARYLVVVVTERAHSSRR